MWVNAVPKDQFRCIRWNCSKLEDFNHQAGILKDRFIQKGYDVTYLEISDLDRKVLLKPKKRKKENVLEHQLAFLTTFSRQHKWVKKTLAKYWKVLKEDSVLGPALPDRPKVIFKRTHALKDLFAPIQLKKPSNLIMFVILNGFCPCRQCNVCTNSKTIRTSSFSSSVTSKTYAIKDFHHLSNKGGGVPPPLQLRLSLRGKKHTYYGY